MTRTILTTAILFFALANDIAIAQGNFQPGGVNPPDRTDQFSSNPARQVDVLPSSRSFDSQPSNDLRNANQPSKQELAGGFQAVPESPELNANYLDASNPRRFENSPPDHSIQPESLSEQLIQKFSIVNAAEPLPGYPLKLADALRNCQVDRRKDLVQAYWGTYSAWANVVLATDHLQHLNQVSRPEKQPELALLNTSRQAASNDLAQAKFELAQSQRRLQLVMNSAPSEMLPLPCDTPIVNLYETHFEWYANHAPLTAEVSIANQSLPELLQLIENRAQSIRVSEVSTESARQGYVDRQVDLALVLYACDQCWANWSKWARSVSDYNLAISEYSLRVAAPGETPERIAKMLVAPMHGSIENTPDRLAADSVYEGMIQPVRATMAESERFAEDHRASIIERPENTASSILNQGPASTLTPLQQPAAEPPTAPKGDFVPRRQSGTQFKLGG